MSFHIPPKDDFFPPKGDMEYWSKPKKSLKVQKNSKNVNESILVSRGSKSAKNPGKFKVESCQGQPHLNHHDPLQGKDANSGIRQSKSSTCRLRQDCNGEVTKDDELVKHMTNLPAFLQRVERGESLQGKALNYGVLDWSRLEKFTYKTKAQTLNHQKEEHVSPVPGSHSHNRGGLPQSAKPTAKKFVPLCSHDVENSCESMLGPNMTRTYKFSRGNRTEVTFQMDTKNSLHRRTASELGGSSQDLGNTLFSLSSKESNMAGSHCEANTRIEKVAESGGIGWKKKDERHISQIKILSSKLKGSIRLKEKLTTESETYRTVEKSEKLDKDTTHKYIPEKKSSTSVLLSGRCLNNFSMDISQNCETTKMSDQCFTEANQSDLSKDFSSGELHPRDLYSEVPHSCPMLLKVDDHRETVVKSLGDKLGAAPSFSVFHGLVGQLPEGKKMERGSYINNVMPNSSKRDGTENGAEESFELAVPIDRRPPSHHRSRSTLGRISRSFSFRETASAPRSSSPCVAVRSSQMASEDSLGDAKLSREKTNSRARSGALMLRRLLDPLLKSKQANLKHRAGNIQPLKEDTTSSISSHVNDTESLYSENCGVLLLQGILQFTSNDGVPSFKFVVGKNFHMIATATKESVSSGKNYSVRNYTFYSVDEMKKKGNSWIGHATKIKSSGFVEKIVGHMVIHDDCSENLNELTIVRECVLSTCGSSDATEGLMEPATSSEQAAIVYKIPLDRCSHRVEQNENEEKLIDRIFTAHLQGKDHFSNSSNQHDKNRVTVILPRGVHTLPSKGEPSSLINRWRSGGACDCGGWDAGCQLQILSDSNDDSEASRASTGRSLLDHLDLFVQGENQLKSAIFSMTFYKSGTYLVEFDSSITSLQAFSICIAVLSCQLSPEPSALHHLSKLKASQEHSDTRNDSSQPSNEPHVKSTARYAQFPPFSPLDRV